MKTTLLDLSGKIDPLHVSLYGELTNLAASIGTLFLLVGATARDTILEQGFEIRGWRATNDIDVAVRLSNWSEFEKLSEELLASGHFTKEKDAQRFLFRGKLLLDILPFGEIASPNNEVSWPPHQEHIMSVAGFEEAYRTAQPVRMRANPPLDILVATPAGLVIMKIVAWSDRPSERSRDAQDIAHMLERYLDVDENNERLHEDHDDLTRVESFDYVRAGARLLGRDIGRIASPETRTRLLQILDAETAEEGSYHLVQAMTGGRALDDEEGEHLFDGALANLRELSAGIRDAG